MTHNLGLGAGAWSVAEVDRKLKHVADQMKELDTGAYHDLADMFGHNDQSTAVLEDFSDRAVVNKTMAADVQQLIRVCQERNQALDGHLRQDENLDDLGALVREEEESVGQRAFDHILRNPNISVAMLQRWGPAWSDKLEMALRDLDRPSQLPIGIVKDLQGDLHDAQGDLTRARGEIAQLLEDKAKLATELEAVRSLQAEQRQSAAEKLQSAKRQAREAIEENKRLRDQLASLDKESAASKTRSQEQEERAAVQTSLIDASINVMESITDSPGQRGDDWDTLLRYVIDSPRKLAAESDYAGWLWLDVWSGDMSKTDKTCPRACHGDQALIKLFFALRRDELLGSGCEALTLLQSVVSALAAAAEVSEGLCKLATDAISGMPACELPTCLMLGQILQIVSQRWPLVGADLSGFVGRQRAWLKGADGALVEAILQGRDGSVCDVIPLYVRAASDESSYGVAVVESVDMFLFVDAHAMRLRWIGAGCADWEHFSLHTLAFKAPSGTESIEVWPGSGKLACRVGIARIKRRASHAEDADDAWEGFSD